MHICTFSLQFIPPNSFSLLLIVVKRSYNIALLNSAGLLFDFAVLLPCALKEFSCKLVIECIRMGIFLLGDFYETVE